MSTKAEIKARAIREFKVFWMIAVYLWLVLGAFTIYRRLILAQAGDAYLHYGVAVVEALVIAKVIVVGRLFGFSRRFDDEPLIVPVLYKTILFGVLIAAFGIVEHLVQGWIHEQGLLAGLRSLGEVGAYELGARMLILMLALVPFFAFGEIVRVLGARDMVALYFSKREASREMKRPAS